MQSSLRKGKDLVMRSLILATTILAGLALCLAVAVAQRTTPSTPEEDAIRKDIEAYSVAYNKGDLQGIMSFWAQGAEYVDDDGTVTRGKEAISALFKKSLAERKGKTLRVKVTSLRLLRPDLAMLDGTTELTGPDGDIDTDSFASVWTKTGERWQILSVRDLSDSDDDDSNPSANELRSLDWLVGDWVHQEKDSVIAISCRKTEKKSFLLIDQVVQLKGDTVLSLKQIIGWDPLRQEFRSWVFDSAGGFGEGEWTRQGNEWVVSAEGVRSDGRTASSTNTWRFIDANTFEWTSTDREIDGQPDPDMRVRYVRKAPAK
jgi:uncharacterized protein (TIGR02246 family)